MSAWRDWAGERSNRLRERARENPGVVISAAATAALAVAAAIVLPMLRRKGAFA